MITSRSRVFRLLHSDDSGIVEAVRQTGASRNIVLILNEWKTDAMASFALIYNVELRILGS